MNVPDLIAKPAERTQRGLMQYCMADPDELRDDMDGGLERVEAYAAGGSGRGARPTSPVVRSYWYWMTRGVGSRSSTSSGSRRSTSWS